MNTAQRKTVITMGIILTLIVLFPPTGHDYHSAGWEWGFGFLLGEGCGPNFHWRMFGMEIAAVLLIGGTTLAACSGRPAPPQETDETTKGKSRVS
jgi:hypothetical protein